MKRCPQCEFLYYDDQDRCDIDGTRLNFTTKLPTLPAEAAQKKALRSTLMFLLLATIILGILLFIFYPPQLRISTTSSPAAKVTPASVLGANSDSQVPPESSPHRTSTPSPRPAAYSRDPFASMDTRSEKSDKSLPPSKPKVTIIAPANRSFEAKPAVNQVTTANQTATTSEKPTIPTISTSSPSVRPVAVATATPKPVMQNSNKDSKFSSMMKKAGRFLKKPF